MYVWLASWPVALLLLNMDSWRKRQFYANRDVRALIAVFQLAAFFEIYFEKVDALILRMALPTYAFAPSPPCLAVGLYPKFALQRPEARIIRRQRACGKGAS